MRNKGVVVVLSIIITLLCLYYLSFTFVSRKVQQDALAFATEANGNVSLSKKQVYLDSMWNKTVYDLLGKEYTYKDVKENELSLGLDLQGGMHVVLEVSPADIIIGLAGNKQDPKILSALKKARILQRESQENFVDLFYSAFREDNPNDKLSTLFSSSNTRGRISSSANDAAVITFLKSEIESGIDRSFTILKTRIDHFGTSQPNIQRLQGTGAIQIEIPGADNPQRVRKLLQGVAHLEFWEIVEPNDPNLSRSLTAINSLIVKEQSKGKSSSKRSDLSKLPADTTASDLERMLNKTDTSGISGDSLLNNTISPLFRFSSAEAPFFYNLKDTSDVNRLLRRADVQAIFPKTIGYFWDVKSDPDVTPGIEDLQLNFYNYGRAGKALLEGDVITDARMDYDQYARPAVSMNMNATGARQWAKITANASSKNPPGRIAIVLDKYVYTAPSVQGEIPNGNSQITGSFTTEEAKDLANVLKAGSLPAPTRIVEEAIVGPTLGQTAQNQGLISMACGLAIVVLFMVAYYSKGGLVATIALLFNVFFILGILAQLNAALTLPGIAGIVLTMGMAVDANVLIFERIREEIRNGRRLRDAITKGYQRAFASIFDSNLTTFLTALFLFMLGQGPLRGFAITLMIGIGTSFFSAVYISRVIIEWMVRNGDESNVSFTTGFSRRFERVRNFDFIGKRKVTYVISGIIITIGFIAIIVNGLNLGVDFKGGRSYVVAFAQPVVATDVRVALANSFENQGTEVKNYGGNNVLKVTTSYLIDDDSDQADEKIKNALIQGVMSFSGLTYTARESQVDSEHFTISSSSKVGATVADDIKNSAFKASLFSLLGIFLYLLFRFRKWQYSAGAIIATLHDALFVFAAFGIAAVLGFPFEIDQVFVAAILTIIGYSINDTVIIYDRIREQLSFGSKAERKQVFNDALNITLSRTLITSGTTLFVVIVLLLFGGEVLRGFSFALFIGIVVGTYSSIFIAAPVVLDMDLKDEKHAGTEVKPAVARASRLK
ncbi:MAG TPA: protein translocase subunit SecDF [Cyclobacteriaceae bacterium]|nr:protein translocase subunit SecDF [Cyclobacteriaceae bacterium]